MSQKLAAPAVSPDDLEEAIATEHYLHPADAPLQGYAGGALTALDNAHPLRNVTLCVLTLKNGYTVIGKSACVSRDNFDPQIGRKYAREDAVKQLWPLLGFLLAEQLSGRMAARLAQ